MPTKPFPVDPQLLAIALAYKNPTLIADEIFPYVPVGRDEFKYYKFPKGEAFTLPDTKVGRKSEPNQVEFSAEEVTDMVRDYGLDDFIPQSDIESAPENYDPVSRAVEGIMNLVLLDREVRAANLAFDPANYATGNKVQLSGTDQWNDQSNSDPIQDIQAGIDACIMRPNYAAIGHNAWSTLQTHPDVVKAVNRTAGDKGIAARRAVADLFELEDIFVGRGWVNSNKKGQTVSLSRVWGKHMLLYYRDETADTRGGLTYGFTARQGDRIAGQMEEQKRGLSGGTTVRAGEKVKEVIVANDLGYFIQDAVA